MDWKEFAEKKIKKLESEEPTCRDGELLAMLYIIHDHQKEHSSRNEHRLERKDAEHWNSIMQNEDGTTGGMWTEAQTTDVAKRMGVAFKDYTPCVFNVAMNMMYSDYYGVAKKYNLDMASFCADMAKAFLMDKDGGSPTHKLGAYYFNIVK